MNVRELIEALQNHDPESRVITEGCDCWGDVAGIWPYQDPRGAETPGVVLYRTDGDISRDLRRENGNGSG